MWSIPAAAPAAIAMTPAVWAMPSMMSTPGNTGWPGKWPWKMGSLKLTFLMPMAESSLSISMMRSIIRNG
ncbi:hypothetical protein D3C86_2143140 [compost metagenome]